MGLGTEVWIGEVLPTRRTKAGRRARAPRITAYSIFVIAALLFFVFQFSRAAAHDDRWTADQVFVLEESQ